VYQQDLETDDTIVTRAPVTATLGSDTPGAAALAKSTTGQAPGRPGPAIRRFTKEVKKSIAAEAYTDAVAPSSSSKATLARTATHVQIPKRGRGRPRKDPSAATDIIPVSDPPIPSSLGKRKPSAGSQPYTPAKSSIKKVLRDAKRPKTISPKKVGFVEPAALEEDKKDPRYPASPVQRPVRAATVSKAAAAGQAKKKRAKKVMEERVSEGEYERRMQTKRKGVAGGVGGVRKGTTRSGAKFGM